MTDASLTALTATGRPYGRHAAPRGAVRTVPSTRSRGAHRPARAEHLTGRAPLAALVALFVVLAVTVVAALTVTTAAAALVERPAHVPTVAEYEHATNQPADLLTGTDAGLITSPAH